MRRADNTLLLVISILLLINTVGDLWAWGQERRAKATGTDHILVGNGVVLTLSADNKLMQVIAASGKVRAISMKTGKGAELPFRPLYLDRVNLVQRDGAYVVEEPSHKWGGFLRSSPIGENGLSRWSGELYVGKEWKVKLEMVGK